MAGPVIEKAIPFGNIVDVIAGVFVLLILITHADAIVKLVSGVGGTLNGGLSAVKGGSK